MPVLSGSNSLFFGACVVAVLQALELHIALGSVEDFCEICATILALHRLDFAFVQDVMSSSRTSRTGVSGDPMILVATSISSLLRCLQSRLRRWD
jgi:hypothetical protein